MVGIGFARRLEHSTSDTRKCLQITAVTAESWMTHGAARQVRSAAVADWSVSGLEGLAEPDRVGERIEHIHGGSAWSVGVDTRAHELIGLPDKFLLQCLHIIDGRPDR